MTSDSLDPMSLPEVSDWVSRTGGTPSLLDVVGENASPTLVLAVARFLFPRLIEVRGCVLLSWAYGPDEFEEWWSEFAGNRAAIEATINHLHLWDVFGENCDDHVIEEIGVLLRQAWSCELQRAFPDREFQVDYSNDAEDYGPTLVFYSKNQ